MQLGFVGLGKVGLNMVTRLQQGGHHVVAYRVGGAGAGHDVTTIHNGIEYGFMQADARAST